MKINIQDRESIKELIGRRRRQLTVHSFIYYQLNNNIISDSTFDLWSKQLVDLQTKHPDIAAEAPYAEEFKTFDGSTGFDLPYNYPEFQQVAYALLNYEKKKNQ